MSSDRYQSESAMISMSIVRYLGGLSGSGINTQFQLAADQIVLSRSRWGLVFGFVGIVGFALAPLFLMGLDEVRLVLNGDFAGERWFLVVLEPLLLLVLILFLKNAATGGPKAVISRHHRYIEYTYANHDSIRVNGDEIDHIALESSFGAKHRHTYGDIYYAVAVRLRDSTDQYYIATHASETKMETLAKEVAAMLRVKLLNERASPQRY